MLVSDDSLGHPHWRAMAEAVGIVTGKDCFPLRFLVTPLGCNTYEHLEVDAGHGA